MNTNSQHEEVDAVVVGGGMAGLTAAAYVARAGRSVVALGSRAQPAGVSGNVAVVYGLGEGAHTGALAPRLPWKKGGPRWQ